MKTGVFLEVFQGYPTRANFRFLICEAAPDGVEALSEILTYKC